MSWLTTQRKYSSQWRNEAPGEKTQARRPLARNFSFFLPRRPFLSQSHFFKVTCLSFSTWKRWTKKIILAPPAPVVAAPAPSLRHCLQGNIITTVRDFIETIVLYFLYCFLIAFILFTQGLCTLILMFWIITVHKQIKFNVVLYRIILRLDTLQVVYVASIARTHFFYVIIRREGENNKPQYSDIFFHEL